MSDLEVMSGRGPYRVRFVRGAAIEAGPREHVIADGVLAEPLLGDSVLESQRELPAGTLLVEAGERLKSLEEVERIAELLLERGVSRGDRLVAIGGATVSDVVGFLAATLLRGLPWRAVPTTLLAQADACVGGKTGVNVGGRKNALGSVTPPDDVLVDVTWLRTLDDRSWRSGLGEVLKAHAIDGPEAFDGLAAALPHLRSDEDALEAAVRRSLVVKKGLVEVDEDDRGQRRLLNYGHTFGHALEVASGFMMAHGIAVALGMRMANRLASRLGLLDDEREIRMGFALDTLTFDAPKVPTAAVVAALMHDKKRVGDGHRFVVLGRGALAAEIRLNDDDARIEEAIDDVLSKRVQTRR